MQKLSVNVLGNPLVHLDDQPVTHFRSAKSLALLAYLAMSDGVTHPRTHLVTLFWPELPEANGRQNLSQTLSRLRKTLDTAASIICATRQAVWLDASTNGVALELDVRTFRQLLAEVERHAHENQATCDVCQPKLAQAVALVRGELLAGVGIDGSLLFDEWRLLEQEKIHQLLLGALKHLADGAILGERYEEAVRYARQQIELEPWREVAHRQLIRALALSGRRNAALAQYEQCRTVLREELGVEPTQVTQKLATTVREGTLSRTAPPPQAKRLPHNLPQRLTPFIGRAEEITAVVERLTGEARLVTLTGPGGMGKTRLAQEVGRVLADQPPPAWSVAEVWFVSLVGVSTAANVPTAIANSLRLSLPKTEAADTAVIAQLRDRRLLLILDNFELLLESRPWLLALLEAAEGVRLLVTSREHLRLLAEHRFALRGLTLPPENALHTEALDYEASRLFVDRARRLYADFRLTDENWSAVRRICHLTAGLPLGIELAVTLLENQTPTAVAEQITADAATLATDYLDIAPHQRHIQHIFERSWTRLSANEQHILSRLSIFQSDAFSRKAAQAVAGAHQQALDSLVRKSLLQESGTEGYGFHPLYKGFAAQKLPIEEMAGLQEAHGRYFAHLLNDAVPPRFDKEKQMALPALLPLLPDLRLCWQWHLDTAVVDLIEAVAWPLYRFLRDTAQLPEGRKLFGQGWQLLSEKWPAHGRDEAQAVTLAHIAAQLGFFHIFSGAAQDARPHFEFALTTLDAHQRQDDHGRELALAGLSDALKRLGKDEANLHLLQQEVARLEALGDSHAEALQLIQINLGEALHQAGRLEEAQRLLQRALMSKMMRNEMDSNLSVTLNNLGLLALALGNLAEARTHLERNLHIRLQYSNLYRIAAARLALGLLALAEGNLAEAQAELQLSLAQNKEAGRMERLVPVYIGLARVAMAEQDWDTAVGYLREAFASAVVLQQVLSGLSTLWRWGEYLWLVGRRDEALSVLAYVWQHDQASGLLVREVNEFLAAQQMAADEITAVPVAEIPWTTWQIA